ncbi:MAG: hypothetical protein ACYC8T_07445 [Myxococcaceae bacterium]
MFRSPMRSELVVLSMLVLATAACRKGPSDAELAETRRLLLEARRKVEPRDLTRRRGLAEALGRVVPRPDLGSCPVKLDYANPLRPAKNRAFDLDRMTRQAATLERLGLEFLKPGEVMTRPGPLLTSFTNAARSAETWAPERARGQIARFEAEGTWDWDLVVIEETSELAKMAGGESFDGGFFIGTAYLWSFVQQKVLCAAAIRVKLPEKMSYRTVKGADPSDNAHDFELSANVKLGYLVLDQATGQLVLAGPRADAEAPPPSAAPGDGG